jgi:outer membrane immunogenic protein
MKLRSLVLGSVAAAALSAGGAFAADLPARGPAVAPAPVYAAPIFTWSGFYVGLNAGYAGDKFQYPFSGEICPDGCEPYGGKPSITSSGGVFGAQIGYNWQFASRWVLGIEADYQWSNIEGKVNINGFLDGIGDARLSAGSEVTSFGTVRARLGYGWDRALLYVTGGWAYGRVKSGGSLSVCDDERDCLDGSLSKRTTGNGWTVGAGLEYALTNNLSFKTEYLFVDLGDKNLYSQVYGDFATARLDVDTRFHVVRAGLNWRFWSGGAVAGPVVARY